MIARFFTNALLSRRIRAPRENQPSRRGLQPGVSPSAPTPRTTPVGGRPSPRSERAGLAQPSARRVTGLGRACHGRCLRSVRPALVRNARIHAASWRNDCALRAPPIDRDPCIHAVPVGRKDFPFGRNEELRWVRVPGDSTAHPAPQGGRGPSPTPTGLAPLLLRTRVPRGRPLRRNPTPCSDPLHPARLVFKPIFAKGGRAFSTPCVP